MNDDERLLARLIADTGSDEAARDLLPIMRGLRRVEIDTAGARSDVAFVDRLADELLTERASVRRPNARWWMTVWIAQIRVLKREIWAASAFIMGLGALIACLPSADGLIFAAFAPIAAAAGIAFLYDEDAARLLELEETTPITARRLLLARLALVFAFDLALACGISALLAFARADVGLAALIASWLAPMTFLSALAFALSIVIGETLAAAMFSFTLWFVHLILRGRTDAPIWEWLSLPGLSAPDSGWGLFVAAVTLIGAAFWWVGNVERRGSDRGAA
jgi:hypothetical protein